MTGGKSEWMATLTEAMTAVGSPPHVIDVTPMLDKFSKILEDSYKQQHAAAIPSEVIDGVAIVFTDGDTVYSTNIPTLFKE